MLLASVTLLLLAMTAVFSYHLAALFFESFVKILVSGFKGLAVKKYRHGLNRRLSFSERVEFSLIDKSNIRHYIPFASFYTLAAAQGLIFLVSSIYIYRLLLFLPSTLIVSALISLVPVFILDLMGRYNSEAIRRKLAYFISVLNRWCAVKEDIFYAFEKSVDSGIGEPLRTFVRDMVIQVNRGIRPLDALELLQAKVDNPQFRDFILNIKQNVRFRGDIRKLLTNLEDQFYKIEEEYNRRKISTYKDRVLLFLVMIAVIPAAYYFLKGNGEAARFYMGTVKGKMLLTMFCMLYAGGTYISLGISRFNH